MSYDPYTAKVEMADAVDALDRENGNPMVSAQPVVYPAVTTVGTVSSAPVQQALQARAVQYHQPLQAQQEQQQPGRENSRARPPPHRWADGICDWPSNLFPSCWCVCCCYYGLWLIAQMAQKTRCCNFTTVLWVSVGVWFIALVLDLALGAGIIVWVPLLYSLVFSIVLRLHIVRRDNITECGVYPCPGAIGEICCGFWCWYCSVAQMARHLYGYSKVLDGDGDPDRADNYRAAGIEEV